MLHLYFFKLSYIYENVSITKGDFFWKKQNKFLFTPFLSMNLNSTLFGIALLQKLL